MTFISPSVEGVALGRGVGYLLIRGGVAGEVFLSKEWYILVKYLLLVG